MIVHDVSYMLKVDALVCLAGFMLRCTVTGCQAKGVVEKSEDTNDYRAEILGGIIVQLALCAA